MTSSKPRRTIFDTLKKSAPSRLGLADAARLADKISAGPPVAGNDHPKRSPETIVQNDQSNRPLETISQTDPSDRSSDHFDQSNRAVERSPESIRQNDHPDEPVKQITQNDQAKRSGKTIRQNAPASGSSLRIAPPEIVRTNTQKKVYDYVLRNGDHITTTEAIALEIQAPAITVRRVLTKLEQAFLIGKKPWRSGCLQGLRLWPISQNDQSKRSSDMIVRSDQAKRPDEVIRPNDQAKRAIKTSDQNAPLKKDRRDILSISQERVELTWPNLAATGFGSHQIEQIAQALAELGKSADKIVPSLDHAEWELEHGRMLDKDGNPVTDPCSWVFRSLARAGYYRKPKGYVSPEEQALIDAEATAKALLATRQRAEQAQFEAWKGGLSPEDLEAAMAGYVGGPREQWLKTHWKKKCRIPGTG